MNTYAVGLVYIFTAATCVPFHLAILRVFWTSQKYLKQPSYQIIFCMGISDLIQLQCHLYSGVVTITGIRFNRWLEKILGGGANAGWLVIIALTLTLALNRWNVIVFRGSASKAFTVLIILSHTFGGVFFVIYLSPYCSIVYFGFYWYYSEAPWSHLVSQMEYWSAVLMLGATFLIYVWIVVALLQESVVVFLYATLLTTMWHHADKILPAAWQGNNSIVAINTAWILFSGLSPALNLTMNRDLRREVFVWLRCSPVNNKVQLFKHTSVVRSTVSLNRN